MIFVAPPCGTASRARGRPIKSSLLQGRKAPQPLRSDEKPDGLDNLQGTDKLKTELANQLYSAISDVVLLAESLDVCVVLENPANSLYWKTTAARRFLDKITGFISDFHNCCHGGATNSLGSGATGIGLEHFKFFVVILTSIKVGNPRFRMDALFSLRLRKPRILGSCVRALPT